MTSSCADLKSGTRAIIDSLSGSSQLQSRLMAMGARPGQEISIIRKAPLGCPIEVSFQNTHVALRREDARQIVVQVSPI